MHPIAERIMAGEDVCMGEIHAANARTIIARDRIRMQRGPHSPDGCKISHCDHNIGDNLDFAAFQAEQAIAECTCGARNH